ncbi:PPOX class F420-dependent oxidoreductase [Lentzea sp. CA-135723]|uniref:PPOX class F420-dependent oxidoreductase n=1 Tax=Lentzea sp. CA-135723 TaxID=3239950 RepID=UPI003D8DC434
MVTLSAAQHELLDGLNYGAVATLAEDGSPQTSVVWITRDGDDVLFSTAEDRAKARHLRNDPRASITVIDVANPYRYAEFRGEATVTTEGAAELVDALAHKYTGKPFPSDKDPDAVRVVVRLKVSKTTGNVR